MEERKMRPSDRAVCERIKFYRLRSGMTQRELAVAVGVSVNSVSAWETFVFVPSLTHLCSLVDIFKCSFNDIAPLEPFGWGD